VPRKAPPDRFRQLVTCATRVFIAQGYRRTQMDDVAREMGVAKGTLYLYVESKEALFYAVVRHLDGAAEPPRELPLPTPKPGAIVDLVRQRFARNPMIGDLAAIGNRRRTVDARRELESVVRRMYATLARERTAIKLADRCAADIPELATLWFEHGRYGLLGVLTRYLETRIRRKVLRPVAAPATTARLLLELVVFWAVHRHWDPAPQPISDRQAEEAVVDFVLAALLPTSTIRKRAATGAGKDRR
jgi:AcrR family transcriptional regulator